MSTATLVSVDEYLRTMYEPDCDYVEGVLEERNVGTKKHSRTQGGFIRWLLMRWEGKLEGFVEMRIRITTGRYRIPDVCIVHSPSPDEDVFTTPPYICVEVLSPEDTWGRLRERLDDYLAMGVPNIWVVDPVKERGYRVTREGILEVADGVLKTGDGVVSLPLTELFA